MSGRSSAVARVDEPARDSRRPEGPRVDRRMRRPAVGQQLAVALDCVLVAESRSLHLDATGVHQQPVVELRRLLNLWKERQAER